MYLVTDVHTVLVGYLKYLSSTNLTIALYHSFRGPPSGFDVKLSQAYPDLYHRLIEAKKCGKLNMCCILVPHLISRPFRVLKFQHNMLVYIH